MGIFDGFPAYDRFRTLHLTGPHQVGADVFALQTALEAIGLDTGGADGILGNRTALAILEAQKKFALSVDGLAGGLTQQALALRLARAVRLRHGLPSGALHGQLEHESGFRLGNYSPERPDGSYDAGVAQRNTAHTQARAGFHVPDSIEELGWTIRTYFDLFDGVAQPRRWALAQGAWNAPAFACFIANEEGASVSRSRTVRPGDAARATFESYVASVNSHVR